MSKKKSRKEESSFVCSFCTMEFTYSSSLETHLRCRHAVERHHKCEICEFGTTDKMSLLLHMRVHTGKNHYTCQSCPFQCTERRVLRSHIVSTHSDTRPFTCTLCAFKTKSKSILAAHTQTHTKKDSAHKCDLCPYKSAHVSRVRSHIAIVHNNKKEIFPCSTCPFTTSQQIDLDSHVLTHTRSNVQVKVERPVRPCRPPRGRENTFNCRTCRGWFFNSEDLKYHEMLHENENTFDDVPTIRSVKKGHHSKVKVKVEKKKLFKCTLCDYTSDYAYNIQRHERVHEKGVRVEQCPECGFKCIEGQKFTRHMKRHHESVDYFEGEEIPCGNCQFLARDEKSLALHFSHKHNLPTVRLDRIFV